MTWKGGITSEHDLFYGSSVWKNMRKFVLKQDNYSCLLCGAKKDVERLSIHHILPISENWDDRLDPRNLVTLCNSCHKKTFSREGMFMKNLMTRVEGSWRFDEVVRKELLRELDPIV
jgi:5-methylcytosine-specific restriction endonuclease McrA